MVGTLSHHIKKVFHSFKIFNGRNVSRTMTGLQRGIPRSHDPVKSLSVIYHICQTRLEMIIEGDLNLRALQFARPLILLKSENISVSLPKDGQYALK